MSRFAITRGLSQATIAAVVVMASVSWMGCGSELSTTPQLGSYEDGTGEVPIPLKDAKLPRPQGFAARILVGTSVELSWRSPGLGYQAHLTLDGV